jgi:hypothetical protein
MNVFPICLGAFFLLLLVVGLYAGLLSLLAWVSPARFLELDRMLRPSFLRLTSADLPDEKAITRGRSVYLVFFLITMSIILCIALTILGPAIGAFLMQYVQYN